VKAAVVPHRREIGAELAVPRRRELEVVRLRNREKHARQSALGLDDETD
jgi:hypothetical protein